MRKTADEVFKVSVDISLGTQINSKKTLSTGKDELLETAMRLHDVAMKDEYFIKR